MCSSDLGSRTMTFRVSETARALLLREGTDQRYGARHLKRAIERRLVNPLANLIATGQLRDGDNLAVDLDATAGTLLFSKEYEEKVSVAA